MEQEQALSLIENFTALVGAMLEGIFGAGATRALVGGVSWAEVVASLLLLAAILVIWAVLRLIAGMLAKKSGEPLAENIWRQAIVVFARPLGALVWIYGVYLALLPLLVKAQGPAESSALVGFAGKILDFLVFAVVVWCFYRTTHVLHLKLQTWVKRTETKIDDLLVPPVIRTLRVVLPLLAIILGLPLLGLPSDYDAVISKITSLVVIGVLAWVLFQAVHVAERFLLAKFNVEVPDNLEARKIHTQARVLSRTLYFVITIFTIASMLMVFEEVRRFGTNILASAGVVGIILGFAAQRTIANLFAGFQLAMAQPIRIDDVVIVEGEWGRVEEITLTYVVIKIWDQRRLIVPLSYFIEKPFQNWTRVSADILGSVFVYADYTVPLEAIREETKRLVESNANWDRKFWNVQVTDSTERAMQIRVLATSSDSGKAWNLRCDIREQLIAFLQKNHASSLPKVRAEICNLPEEMNGISRSPALQAEQANQT